MSRIHWQEHISVDPDLHHGDPCIKGTRIPVATIVGSLADGMSTDEVRSAFPQLSSTDILAALAYAADVLSDEMMAPLAA
ncbi:MAG: DUF433 domain-containing protein [Chloroflexi bacterium]|nr:DUF433 domain-containing protein [Chloroflexota bacterium]